MNNKCGCGWEQGCQPGFVPVTSNWDFNMDGCCQRQRQNRGNACEKNNGTRRTDCACERAARREDVCGGCGKTRNACTCGQNTRRTDCACERAERREDVCGGCGKTRSACTCGQMNYTGTERCEERTAPACVMKTETPACGGAKKGVGMVRVTKQTLGDIFDNGRALKAGTLFPELHKPMNGYWPCENACGDACQQAAFAAWELRLYLNTHPCDKQALALLKQLTGDCCEPNYATTFLEDECSRWTWTDDPWPWEVEFKANQNGCCR
nr:spore coat protein CotJB [Clostridia bacterium]